jgi:hypothetical protein
MLRVSFALLVVLSSCKKEPPAGMAPTSDWGQGGSAQGSGGGGATANPHAGGGGGNPHGGMAGGGGGGGNPHGGGGNPHGAGGGGGGMVPDAMPTKTGPRTLEKTADGRSVLGPFTVAMPKEWTEKAVTSNMRAAQFDLDAKEPGAHELVIYYFGTGGAGGVEANLERWLGQISQADGKPSKDVAKIEKTKLAGQDATLVSVTGNYKTQQMPGGPPGVDKTNQTMLGAIIDSPTGPYYFKLVGAKPTVDANMARWKAMLASIKLK